MGRMALMSVLALATAFSIIGINLRDSGTEASRAQSNYIRYSAARNIARAAVNLRLREVDKDTSGKTAIVGRIDGTFYGATYYTIADTGKTRDTLRIQSVGTYEGTSYQMRIKLQRFPKPFPDVNAGLGIRAEKAQFTINGKAYVDGRNYSADGKTLQNSGDKAGVTVMDSEGLADVNQDTAKIYGSPDAKIDTTTANPADFINEYRANADFYYGPGEYPNNITWGSPTNPVIVFCETSDTTQTVHFSGNVTGWGILVIIGSLKASGNFSFFGLTVVYGANNKVDITASGNATFVGGLIMAGGKESSFTINGQGNDPASVKYSSAALYNARFIRKLLAYKVMDWWEE